MSILGQHDELKVFPFPRCAEMMSSVDDVCRHCGSSIRPETKKAAIRKQDEENRNHHIGMHKKMMAAGVGLFFLGFALLIYSIVALYYGGGFFIYSPIMVLLGIGQILYGFNGIRKERKGS